VKHGSPLFFPRRLLQASQDSFESGFSLTECLRQPLFWISSGGIALFAGVQAGIGLFNEALLTERGFDRETYHHFLAGTAIISLIGQGLGGGTRWLPLRRWLGIALIILGDALAAFQVVSGITQLWVLAVTMGVSAGIITVAFCAIWADTFGKRHLGRIMGAAQTLSVLASALGPLLLERGAALTGSFAKSLLVIAPVSVLLGLHSLFLKPTAGSDHA